MLILNQFLFISFSFLLHPVHVSLTNIEYNGTQNKYEITLKFFKDDFNKIIEKKFNTSINLQDSSISSAEKKTVAEYINSHLKISTLKNKITSKCVIKKQVAEYSVWYYLQIPSKKQPQKIQITNTLMLDLYSDQTNLVIVKVGEKEWSEMYSNSDTAFEFSVR